MATLIARASPSRDTPDPPRPDLPVAFTLDDYIRLRPYAYHLTDRANLAPLLVERVLRPAAELLVEAGLPGEIRTRRPTLMDIEIGGVRVVLKDQRPLVFANTELADGWSEGDFVAYLNERVFFWPGSETGPVKHGARLFEAYDADAPVVIRVPTSDLLAANRALTPTFCAFNSGAPRMQQGRRVRRGPDLFTPADTFPRRASEVVEVAFCGPVALPESAEVRTHGHGWSRLAGPSV